MGVLMRIVGIMIMIFSILIGIGGFVSTVFESTTQASNEAYMLGRSIGSFIGVTLVVGPIFGLGLIVFNLPGYIRKQIEKLAVAQAFD